MRLKDKPMKNTNWVFIPAENRWTAIGLCLFVVFHLAGCGPSEQRKLELAEEKRVECLVKLCPGDVEPPHDYQLQEAMKLNGSWYIGPKEYFRTGKNGGGFYWPSRYPMYKGGNYSQADQKFHDKAIEIFLSRPNFSTVESVYQALSIEEKKGHVIKKITLRGGLEVWTTQSGTFLEENWFIATRLRLSTGEPPVIACRGNDPTAYRCSGGFLWTPQIAVGLRFQAIHGPDWPEIYLEINRVLQQLRRV